MKQLIQFLRLQRELKKIFIVIFIAIFSLFQSVWAIDAVTIANYINTTTHGDLITIVNSNTVTVNNTSTGVNGTLSGSDFLTFSIDGGVTVIWQASLSGSSTNLININGGSGVFRMESGNIENTGSGCAIRNNSVCTVNIIGGMVKAASNYAITNTSTGTVTISNSAMISSTGRTAIHNGSNGTINVAGGTVSSTSISSSGNGATIYNVSSGTINITGGTVDATGNNNAIHNTGIIIVSGNTTNVNAINGNAIYNGSSGTVTISKGTISVTTGDAIYNNGGVLTISDGTISGTTGRAIYLHNFTNMINISGNAVITSSNTSGTIYLYSGNPNQSGGNINISGGTIENTETSTNSHAIYIYQGFPNITITGGLVNAIGGSAIYTNNFLSSCNINISGGTISTNGSGKAAIYSSHSSNYNRPNGIVTVTGGAISAPSNGYSFYNESDILFTLGGNPTITGRIHTHDQKLSVLTSGTEFFIPGSTVYTLDFPTYASSMIAVIDGRNFLDNFVLYNPAWTLIQSGVHLAIDSASFVPVSNITNVPNTATAGIWNILTATIEPSNATYQDIVWSVSSTGNTDAVISGHDFFAYNEGTAFIIATIANGKAIGEDYIQNFSIWVKNDVGIEELTMENEKISIYPNPTNKQLTFDNGECIIESIEIIDITGKKLSTFNTQHSTVELDISHLANGIYLVKVKTLYGKIIRKIVKN